MKAANDLKCYSFAVKRPKSAAMHAANIDDIMGFHASMSRTQAPAFNHSRAHVDSSITAMHTLATNQEF